MSEAARRSSRFTARKVTVFALAVMLVLLARPAIHHAKAAELLVRFGDASAPQPAGVVEREAMVPASDGEVRARFYRPAGDEAAPRVVLVQGMHRKGIDEPRLQRFARAVANAGYEVVTPEVRELSDYSVDPRSIDTVGATATWLSRACGRSVGLMGMSFGGGVALLAAADPRFAEHVSFVVTVGAYDDLARVARYFVTKEITDPDGALFPMEPHSYGPMLVVRSHAERFFGADAAVAREAMKLQLWEDAGKARELAKTLGPNAQKKLLQILDGDFSAVKAEVLALVDAEGVELARVSPRGHLGGLRAPAFFLHGLGDNVIPASETMHLARDVPPGLLGGVVISPAIRHVELTGTPTLGEQWELVHWMGGVLGAAG